MTGRFPVDAKVIDRTDEAFAEQVVPDSIHQHSWGEWIFGICQPLSQLQATALSWRNDELCRDRNGTQEATGSNFAGGLKTAALVDREVVRGRNILHGESLRLLGPCGFEESGQLV